jgi:hypothetical protein
VVAEISQIEEDLLPDNAHNPLIEEGLLLRRWTREQVLELRARHIDHSADEHHMDDSSVSADHGSRGDSSNSLLRTQHIIEDVNPYVIKGQYPTRAPTGLLLM